MDRSTVIVLHTTCGMHQQPDCLRNFTSQAVHCLELYMLQPTTAIPLQQRRQPSRAARLAGRLHVRAGNVPQGVAHSVCRRREVASPVLLPPSMRISPPPLGGPACSCPGWLPATMPRPVDPKCSPAVRPASRTSPQVSPRRQPCGVASLEGWRSGRDRSRDRNSVRGHWLAPGVRLVSVPHIQACDVLTCPSMPIMSATRKRDKANHRRVSGPQHILCQGKLLRHGMMHNTVTQPSMEPSLPRRQSFTHAWHQACDSMSEWEGHEQA